MIKKIFYILVFFLPFGFALNPSGNFDLAIMRTIIPSIFLFWIIESLKNKNLVIDIRPRFIFLIIFLFLSFISFFWAPDHAKAFRKILFILSFLPIYFISFPLLRTENGLYKLLKTLFWSNLILALTGVVQFLAQFIFGIDILIKITENYVNPFFLGENFAKSVSQYPSWLVGIGNLNLLRAFSVFPDPHLFSLFLNLSLPLILLLWIKTKNKLHLAGFFIILSASLLTFSRASYVALAIVFIASLFIFNLAQKIIKNPLFIFSVLFLVLSFFVINNPVKERLFSSFNFSEGSVSGRLEMWQKAFNITLNHPIGGVGIGNFSTIVDPTSDLRDPSYAHNLFLDFSSETGILSTFALFLTLASPFFCYFFHPKTLENKILFLSFLILFVHCLFETPFYSVHVFPLILILLAIETNFHKKHSMFFDVKINHF